MFGMENGCSPSARVTSNLLGGDPSTLTALLRLRAVLIYPM